MANRYESIVNMFKCFNIKRYCCNICLINNKKKKKSLINKRISKYSENNDDSDNDSIDDNFDQNIITKLLDLKINEQLDNDIDQWQIAINNYKSFEDYCLDNNIYDVIENIELIKSNPKQIIRSSTKKYSENTIKLAKLRLEVINLKEKLQIDEEIDSPTNTSTDISIKTDTNINDSDIYNDSFTKRVSINWSKHITDVIESYNDINNPLREPIISNIDNNILKLKPKWPDFLVNSSYKVLKRNRLSQKFPRIIKLTEYHLLNIKNGTNISKVYYYTKFKNIYLEDHNTIVITLKSGKLLVFISPIAVSIIQQIITRVKVRLQLDKTSINIIGYNSNITAQLIQNISKENSINSTECMSAFIKELSLRTLREFIDNYEGNRESIISYSIINNLHNMDLNIVDEIHTEVFNVINYMIESIITDHINENMINKSRHLSNNKVVTFNDIINPVVNELSTCSIKENFDINTSTHLNDIISNDSTINNSIISNVSTSQSTNEYNNLLVIKEGMNEYTVKDIIQNMIYDNKTPEGNTKQLFFNNILKNIKDNAIEISDLFNEIRYFIDGMYSHILKKKGIELSSHLMKNQIPYDVNTSIDSNLSNDLNDNIKQLLSIPINVLIILSFIIFTVVEEAVYLPLRDNVIGLMPSYINNIQEEELLLRKQIFQNRSQAQWGIPDSLSSPLLWKSAIFELSTLESIYTPTMMLNTIARTAKAIYSEYKLVVLPNHNQVLTKYLTNNDIISTDELDLSSISNSNSNYLSADDFVPIFIYVFCQSDISHPIIVKDLMWKLCHPDQLQGECGYYLTAFESSIEYILNEILTNNEINQIKLLELKSNNNLLYNRISNSNHNRSSNISIDTITSRAKTISKDFYNKKLGSNRKDMIRQSFH